MSEEQPPRSRPNTETILVIDDDPRICLLIEQLLTRYGYQVRCAADGQQGLALFQQHPVDLVLLDLSMPGLKGEQVLKRLTRLSPEVKVALMTGFVPDEEPLTGARTIIYKPFPLDELLRTVRTLLDT